MAAALEGLDFGVGGVGGAGGAAGGAGGAAGGAAGAVGALGASGAAGAPSGLSSVFVTRSLSDVEAVSQSLCDEVEEVDDP